MTKKQNGEILVNTARNSNLWQAGIKKKQGSSECGRLFITPSVSALTPEDSRLLDILINGKSFWQILEANETPARLHHMMMSDL